MGTRLGRQELLGEVIDEQEGALWNRGMIEMARATGPVPDLARIVVGVDPSVSVSHQSAMCGIVVAGIDQAKHAYVIDDLSGRYSPDRWAKLVVKAYEQYDADRIVAEIRAAIWSELTSARSAKTFQSALYTLGTLSRRGQSQLRRSTSKAKSRT